MKTYSYGMCPDDVIRQACNAQCPNGYEMKIVDPVEWSAIAKAVNQGIDASLEAITEKSLFDNGYCRVHPDEMHVLLRRMLEDDSDEIMSLRMAILSTLDIEEI